MIIQNDAELRQYIPNALVTVEGEQSLFEKLQIELQLSEAWLARTFGVEESTPVTCKIVASDAFLRAIPSLDLVLTANGFGVVSNNTIAPASRDRVDRLIASLEQNRDFAIDTMLHELLQDDTWRATEPAQFFIATLYQTPLSLPRSLHNGKAFAYFEQTHAALALIEQELADKFISHEIYARLRSAVGKLPTYEDRTLITLLQSIEIQLLQGQPLPYKQLIGLVDFIRQRSEIFPEWQNSATAELYKSHIFENKKQSSGYWF